MCSVRSFLKIVIEKRVKISKKFVVCCMLCWTQWISFSHAAFVHAIFILILWERPILFLGSVFFLSRPRSKGWPHHGRTFSIYPCPLSFWLTLPRRVLSMSWCCPSRLCVAFLACMHLALFLALSFSPGSSLVSSWCDHSMLALTVSNSSLFTPALLRTH